MHLPDHAFKLNRSARASRAWVIPWGAMTRSGCVGQARFGNCDVLGWGERQIGQRHGYAASTGGRGEGRCCEGRDDEMFHSYFPVN